MKICYFSQNLVKGFIEMANRPEDTTNLIKVTITMLSDLGHYLDEKYYEITQSKADRPKREPVIIMCVYTVLAMRENSKAAEAELDKEIIRILTSEDFRDLHKKYSTCGRIPKATKQKYPDFDKAYIPPEIQKSVHIKTEAFRIGVKLHKEIYKYRDSLMPKYRHKLSVSALYLAILLYSQNHGIPTRRIKWDKNAFTDYTGINPTMYNAVLPYI